MEGMCLVCGRQSFKLLGRLCEAVETGYRNLNYFYRPGLGKLQK